MLLASHNLVAAAEIAELVTKNGICNISDMDAAGSELPSASPAAPNSGEKLQCGGV